jgi:hypothetical protein
MCGTVPPLPTASVWRDAFLSTMDNFSGFVVLMAVMMSLLVLRVVTLYGLVGG